MRSTILIGIRAGNRCLQGCALAALITCGGFVCAAGVEAPTRYAIHQPAQPLADSLRAVARQTGASLVFDPKAVQGLTSGSISGQFSAAEAIGKLLQGTGLMLAVQPDGALVVRPAPSPSRGIGSQPVTSSEALPPATGQGEPGTVMRMASAAVSARTDGGALSDASTDIKGGQKIEITGSRLRRIDGDTALPVNTYSREEIEKSGQPSLGRFLASLNEISVGQGEGSFSSTTQGQGNVQLRGLPLGSTLVLINGRRIQAGGSSNGNFFNLNLIPLAAVERIEIVPVGSSAVYGGDALAGVVNVILRKSIDGQTFNARVTSGKGFGDGGLSLGIGGSNERDAWMVLGSFNTSTPLNMSDRPFFRDADFRSYGGPDARVRNCNPGTVTSTTNANLPGLGSTFAAIPVTVPGQPLTIQSFATTSGQANLCSGLTANGATALIHGSDSVGLHASGQRNWTGSLETFGELTYVQERVRAEGLGLNFNNVVVPASNPNNPFGVPVRVTARLGPENGHEAYARDTDFMRVLAGLRGELGGGWDFEGAASVSRDTGGRILANNTVNTAARTTALATTNAAASLNPFASGRAASEDVIRSIWSDTVRNTLGRKDIISAFARGPVLSLPAGSVDTIVGFEAARDRFESIQTGDRFVNGRRTGAAYAELRLPLWLGKAEGERDWSLAAVTLAGRRDRYSDFGSASTYQGGLELRPARSLLLRASAATSFKPPTLVQTSVDEQIFPTEFQALTDPRRGNEPIIGGDWVRTTNRNLKPENGKAYALGAVWEPGTDTGSRLAVTAWRVRIDELIGLLPSQTVLDNEALFPGWVIRGPSVGGLPGPVTRVIYAESNFGYVETGGFDLEATQTLKSAAGRWTLSASATRTTKYEVVIAPGAPAADRLGRRFAEYWSPAWKARLAAAFDSGVWSLGITSRYIAAYKDIGTSDRTLGNGWVHDLSGRLDLKRLGLALGSAKAAGLSLSVVNAGNKLPEFAAGSPYFDTSQADWRGRYASLRLSVDW
jgi:iron complex outermembrane receptor protein